MMAGDKWESLGEELVKRKLIILILLSIAIMSYMLCACSVEANNYPLRHPNFDTRIPAAGAVIEPGDGYNLLVAVELHEVEAYASGLEIDYRNPYGRKYVEKSYYAYVFNNDGLPEN